jgi:hypothetical protein
MAGRREAFMAMLRGLGSRVAPDPEGARRLAGSWSEGRARASAARQDWWDATRRGAGVKREAGPRGGRRGGSGAAANMRRDRVAGPAPSARGVPPPAAVSRYRRPGRGGEVRASRAAARSPPSRGAACTPAHGKAHTPPRPRPQTRADRVISPIVRHPSHGFIDRERCSAGPTSEIFVGTPPLPCTEGAVGQAGSGAPTSARPRPRVLEDHARAAARASDAPPQRGHSHASHAPVGPS